ncbi:MAG: hypothetical protein KAW12_16395 [Candidatus Aminicenantes bacterium]|nr:hypothetical protein [Candidatus Aminicenantes bacterium]
MYINEILKEKYRVQAEIAKRNNYDLERIAEEASKEVSELAKKFAVKLNYLDEDDLEKIA